MHFKGLVAKKFVINEIFINYFSERDPSYNLFHDMIICYTLNDTIAKVDPSNSELDGGRDFD